MRKPHSTEYFEDLSVWWATPLGLNGNRRAFAAPEPDDVFANDPDLPPEGYARSESGEEFVPRSEVDRMISEVVSSTYDVKESCHQGVQRCLECNDFECCDNMKTSDLARALHIVHSDAARLLTRG